MTEDSRASRRWVLHVDLDQFLAAVEILRHPELAGRPVVVGGDGDPTKRGVVSTASYEARALGVSSGVPLRTALKRAPDAVFLPVDKDHYEAASAVVMDALRQTGAVVEVLGWDEAFLGVETGDPHAVARDVQRRVLEASGLHCSVGIGRNLVQAKIATGFGKPAGVFELTSANWFTLLGDRPPDVLWGIGSRTARRLAELGVQTVRALAGADPDVLAAAFGPQTGPWLVRLGQGRGSATVSDQPWVRRSRSRETTFQSDLADWDAVRAEVVRLAAQVGRDVADDGRDVVRVVVKLRFVPFLTRTHGAGLAGPTRDPAALEEAALRALESFAPGRAVRLVGVRAEYVPA